MYDQGDPRPKPTPPDLDRRATWRDVPWSIVFTMGTLLVSALGIWFWAGDDDAGPATTTEDIGFGDCLDISGRGNRIELEPVPCDQPHEFQVVKVIDPVLGTADPDDCPQFLAAAGVDLDRVPPGSELAYVEPTDESVTLGIRSVLCTIEFPERLSGSVLPE